MDEFDLDELCDHASYESTMKRQWGNGRCERMPRIYSIDWKLAESKDTELSPMFS